ncbi:14590_t:CDS:1, partial [Cetraspora pellucida]
LNMYLTQKELKKISKTPTKQEILEKQNQNTIESKLKKLKDKRDKIKEKIKQQMENEFKIIHKDLIEEIVQKRKKFLEQRKQEFLIEIQKLDDLYEETDLQYQFQKPTEELKENYELENKKKEESRKLKNIIVNFQSQINNKVLNLEKYSENYINEELQEMKLNYLIAIHNLKKLKENKSYNLNYSEY